DQPSAPTTAVRNALRESSDIIRYDKRRSIRTAQHPVCLVIVDDLLFHRIEPQSAPEAIRCISEMHQRCRDVRFFDRRMDVLRLTATNTVDEVRKMVTGSIGRGAGLDVLRQPCLIRVVPVNAHIALGTIEKVPYRIGFCIDRSDRPDPRKRIWDFFDRRSWSAK